MERIFQSVLVITAVFLPLCVAVLDSSRSTRREESSDVREGQDVTLQCRFNHPTLLSGGQIYWMKQERNGQKDNVAIGEMPLGQNYRVELVPEEGRYDLTISHATYDRDNGMFECRVKEAQTGSDLHTTTVNLTVLIPPGSPHITPEAPTATEEQATDLTCSSQGGSPDPQIIWYREGSNTKLLSVLKPGGGRDFPTTSVLTINPRKEDDGAEFRCVVWNRALTNGEKMVSKVKLNVNYYPRITIGPENPFRVELGSNAILTCSADAKPPVNNVRWTRNGRFLGTSNDLEHNPVKLEDAGRYVCQAENGLKHTVEEAVTLDVLYAPRVSVISSKDVEEGEDILILCNVTANPAPVKTEWLKEGDETFRQSGDILRLNSVSAVNQGNYVCRSVNVLTPTGGDSVDREGNATVAVRVRHAPGKTFITPSEPIAVQDEALTLTCGANPPGWPMPTYRWWRHGSETTLTHGANYTIPTATLQIEGTYYCQPRNKLGKGTPASVALKVYQAPKILDGLKDDDIISAGETDYSITCRAQGKPEPSIRWLKDGEELGSSDYYTVLVEQSAQDSAFTVQSTLQFLGSSRVKDNQVIPQDRGVYECVFKNDVREVSSSLLLRIKHSPITVHKANKVAFDVGEDAVIECRMQSFPPAEFQWFLGPNEVKADGYHYEQNFTKLPDDVYASVLTLRSVTENEYGSYTCKGSNSMGEHSTKISLQSKGPPEFPTNLHIVSKGFDFLELGWEEGFNGGFANTKFSVLSEMPSGVQKKYDCQTRNPCKIKNLSQQTTYKLQVRAYNVKGESIYSDALEGTTLVNEASIPVPQLVYYEISNNLVSFNADLTGLRLNGHVEVQKTDDAEWVSLPSEVNVKIDHGEMQLGDEPVAAVRVKLCTQGPVPLCGTSVTADMVDTLPARAPKRMSMQYMVAIIVSSVVFVAIVALVFICCCCRKRNSKLKNKTAEIDVSHRGVVTQQAPPPPYYTVGMDNKGMENSTDGGLDDPSKHAIYNSHGYGHSGQGIHNGQSNTGMGYMDNSYSNSNNGGSVNSQDSLWQVKGHHGGNGNDPQMGMGGGNGNPDSRHGYQYDPMLHGGYGVTGYDDYSHYPPPQHQGPPQHHEEYPMSRNNYYSNGDPYAAVNKPRRRMDPMDGSYDVSGMPDPYMDHHDTMDVDNKPQISFDESLESGYSTPNSRNRRIIREIIV
ncbi:hemicentin protein echinoid [Oratosquilla oratoria]|uniref:hemicentin protein echinoid n=1 Tax=Oratosquilla oratoria TaxID=337810 RepID=UPI003F758BA2